MSSEDIWYGVLEAGSKTSPVVRDVSIQASSNSVWLYNHARDAFVEYSLAVVEPKLRELTKKDIALEELDKAFRSARKSFASAHKVLKWEDKAPAPKAAAQKDDDIDMSDDDDMEEFIDDVAEDE